MSDRFYNPESDYPMTFADLQERQEEWLSRQPFGGPDATDPLLGIVEEVGELSHAHLKAKQGIRGTAEEHEAAGKDAVGDILIYLADYCTRKGWLLQDIAEVTANTVFRRDWSKNQQDGSDATVRPAAD